MGLFLKKLSKTQAVRTIFSSHLYFDCEDTITSKLFDVLKKHFSQIWGGGGRFFCVSQQDLARQPPFWRWFPEFNSGVNKPPLHITLATAFFIIGPLFGISLIVVSFWSQTVRMEMRLLPALTKRGSRQKGFCFWVKNKAGINISRSRGGKTRYSQRVPSGQLTVHVPP